MRSTMSLLPAAKRKTCKPNTGSVCALGWAVGFLWSSTANNNPSANSYVKVCSTCHKLVSRDKLLFGLHKTQCERKALLRKKNFTCQKCGDKFATEKSMFQHHVSMHAASSMPLYVCKLCPGFYQTSAKSLRNHITRIHKKVPGRLVYNNSQDSTSYFYETLWSVILLCLLFT